MYNYPEHIKRITLEFPEINDSLNYDNSSRKRIYDDFFNFCQQNLSEVCVERNYGMTPAYFYYVDDSDFNAFATSEPCYLIGINQGVIEGLFSFFINKKSFNINEKLLEYKRLEALFKIDIRYLMFQQLTQFIYYHELGHLIQFANANKPKRSEIYLLDADTYDLESHLMEIDADIHGSNSIVFHTINYLANFDLNQNEKNVVAFKLFSLSLSGMFTYLMYLSKDNLNLYYKEYNHPHTIIRLTYILTSMIDAFRKNFSSDFKYTDIEILNESFSISEILYGEEEKVNIVKEYKNIIFTNLPNIRDYISELTNNLPTLPYLASNTIHKKGIF